MSWFNVGDILTAKLLNAVMDEVVATSSPPGMMAPYAAAVAPSGWLLCDGTAVNRSAYAALFAAIGTTFGVGDGSTTFNVPDLRGKIPVGVGGTAFTAVGVTGGEETHALITAELASHTHVFTGTALGTHTHVFTGSALGTHSHASFSTTPGMRWAANRTATGAAITVDNIGELTGNTDANTGNPSTSAVSAGTPAGTNAAISAGTPAGTNANTGTGTAHNNLQPYVVTTYIIKT